MTKTVKCARCGKELVLEGKQIQETVSCDHCHLQMRISEKSQKQFRNVRYFFVFLICIIISLGMHAFTQNNYLILLVMLGIVLLLSNYSDHWCLLLTDKIFSLKYEEYHPVELTKKEKRKQNQQKKQKKGLFR